MQKPIEKNHTQSFFSMLKKNMPFSSKIHIAKVQPQMPAKQISHFAKQSVQNKKPITIQVNTINEENVVTEITGTPFISTHSGHLILKENSKMIHLVQANTIRHIRYS